MGFAEPFEPWLIGPGGHLLALVLGALFGSFANVCIYRMPPSDEFPAGRSIATPGSHCGACKAPIAWYDNVPLVAFLWLRGRCRRCGTAFSPRYLLVEGATALLFAAMFHLHLVVMAGTEPVELRLLRFAIAAAFAFVMVIITFIDLDHKLILDRVTFKAIPAFYALGLLLPDQRWYDGLIGAAVGYGVVRAVSDGYYLLTRRYGMGYGDGKLLAIVGALLGWPAVLVSLTLGSLIGTLVTFATLAIGGARARSRWRPSDDAGDAERPTSVRHLEIPFGPFLAAGALAHPFLEPWLRLAYPFLYS